MEYETTVKLNIYETIAETANVPNSAQVAESLGSSIDEVEAAFKRLHQKRLLVPEPDDPGKIRMAPPFSGVPTPFRVVIGQNTYYANCAWDALGIPAAMHQDAVILSSDAFSGEEINLHVIDEKPQQEPCVIHFAVPAAQWWQDIIYT